MCQQGPGDARQEREKGVRRGTHKSASFSFQPSLRASRAGAEDNGTSCPCQAPSDCSFKSSGLVADSRAQGTEAEAQGGLGRATCSTGRVLRRESLGWHVRTGGRQWQQEGPGRSRQ